MQVIDSLLSDAQHMASAFGTIQKALHNSLWVAVREVHDPPHYIEAAAYLKSLGFQQASEVARVIDIAMHPNSIYLQNKHKRRSVNVSVSTRQYDLILATKCSTACSSDTGKSVVFLCRQDSLVSSKTLNQFAISCKVRACLQSKSLRYCCSLFLHARCPKLLVTSAIQERCILAERYTYQFM